MHCKAFRSVLLACLALAFALCLPAVSHAESSAGLQDADFSCRGVALGDTQETLFKVWGEPLFDKTETRQGVSVKVYVYKDDYTAAVDKSSHVVDFIIKNDRYEARNGIRLGATSYWIQKTYGKAERQHIDGEAYYVYTRKDHPHDHLLLGVDSQDGYLTSWRITSLPISEAEAEKRALEEEEEEGPLDPRFAEKEIDTSALPKTGNVVLKEAKGA
nr:hypothetical protein [uncultured Mitsuokella sp.]